MVSTRGRWLVLGVDPFAEVRCTGFDDLVVPSWRFETIKDAVEETVSR